MANIDQEFVEFIVKSLVNEPDSVKIERSIDEKGVLLELTVAADDLGRVIGKRGNTAQSIRTLLRALGTKNDARYNLKIVDVNGGDRPPRDNRDDNRQQAQQDDNSVANDAAAVVATTAVAGDDSSSSDGASQWAHLSSSSDDDDTLASDEDEAQKTDENKENSVVEKTRQELADLDDLDI